MKSFGSTMDRAGGSLGSMFDNQASGLWKAKKKGFLGKISNTISNSIAAGLNKVSNQLGNAGITASEKIPYSTDPDPIYMYKEQSNINVGSDSYIPNSSEVYNKVEKTGNDKSIVISEDTSKWDQSVIDQMNWYNFSGGVALNSYDQYQGDKGKVLKRYAEKQKVVHSLFNPYYGIDPNYIAPNQPIAALADWGNDVIDLDNCTISKLVELSRKKSTILGQARYKYADFMFCKELGMPNNHLITLRRYSSPVGDMIHGGEAVDTEYQISTYNVSKISTTTTSKGKDVTGITTKASSAGKTKVVEYKNTVQLADVGHMCCYFGGEDNKLEDILKYSFKQTYKNMNADIQRLPSQEDDRTSPLGAIINSTSKGYARHMLNSSAGSNNILKWGAQYSGNSHIQKLFGQASWYGTSSALYHVDKNKIYNPKNTIQEIDYYEGKLQFSHEFSIVFSYKLRSFDNISPKAAMLDLIANITKTCYTAGNFWGGAKQINGPQPNPTAWNKANAFIDKTWDKLGSGLATLLSGGYDMSQILGSISQFASELAKQAQEIASNIVGAVKNGTAGSAFVSKFKSWNSRFGISDQIKGALKDAMGRPQLYAFDSLLSGGDTGMWHLTIGNPLRPIITIGNLEVTNTEIQHLGPLGIDDFPTELKVTVSFKHARPRDAVSIEKMYVFGGKSIYKKHVRKNPAVIYNKFDISTAPETVKTDVNTTEQDDIRPNDPPIEQPKKKSTDKNGNKDSSNKITTSTSQSTYIDETTAAPLKHGGEINDPSAEFAALDYIGEFDFTRMKANMDELA